MKGFVFLFSPLYYRSFLSKFYVWQAFVGDIGFTCVSKVGSKSNWSHISILFGHSYLNQTFQFPFSYLAFVYHIVEIVGFHKFDGAPSGWRRPASQPKEVCGYL